MHGQTWSSLPWHDIDLRGGEGDASRMNRFPWLAAVAALIALAVWCGAAAPLSAQTLDEALGAAYLSNPQLRSAPAQLRATDEQIPQALSGWRPTIPFHGVIREH